MVVYTAEHIHRQAGKGEEKGREEERGRREGNGSVQRNGSWSPTLPSLPSFHLQPPGPHAPSLILPPQRGRVRPRKGL